MRGKNTAIFEDRQHSEQAVDALRTNRAASAGVMGGALGWLAGIGALAGIPECDANAKRYEGRVWDVGALLSAHSDNS